MNRDRVSFCDVSLTGIGLGLDKGFSSNKPDMNRWKKYVSMIVIDKTPCNDYFTLK